MRWYHILVLPLVAAACSSSDPSPPLLEDGKTCTENAKCQSGYCDDLGKRCEARAAYLERCFGKQGKCSEGECHSPIPDGIDICTLTCAGDGDCEPYGGLCVEGWCIKPCGPDDEYGVLRGACVDGRPVPCTDPVAQAASCKTCGCGVGRTCVNDECVAQFEAGHACSLHTDCLSLNCGVPSSAPEGSTSRVCLVGIGEPCTKDNCSSCLQGLFCDRNGCSENGDQCAPRAGASFKTMCVGQGTYSSCSGACQTSDDCSAWTGHVCVLFSNASHGYCQLFRCLNDAECEKWPGTVCVPIEFDASGHGFCLKP